MSTVCLGRQPILDRQQSVLGYRVAPQSDDAAPADISARQIAETLNTCGLEKLIGLKKAFIPVLREELSEVQAFLPAQRFVLEIAADTVQSEDARAALLALIDAGYDVALRNTLDPETLDELLDRISYVMLDTARYDKLTIGAQLERLKGKHAKLVMMNVASHGEFRDYCELGLDYFQGHFLVLPDLDHTIDMKASRLGSMRLLSKLQDPALEFSDLESIIEADVSLSYKLLRYLNSAFFALPSKVDTIKRALLLLGLRPVRNWASMIVLAGFDDKPQELIIAAMLRAKFCELLARAHGYKIGDACFTVGLLSTLDAFLNKPMAECLELVPLADEIKAAILHHEGQAGAVLTTVLAYEVGCVRKLAPVQGQPAVTMADTFLEAVSWVTECSAEIIVGNMSKRAA